MMNVDWLGFSLASIAVVLAPGPGSLFVAKTGARGARHGFQAMAGIMVGDACLISFSFLGVSALFVAHPALFQGVRLAGACYLIFIGLQSIFFAPKREAGTGPQSSAFRRAVSITLLNPKAVLFFMAFFPIFIRPQLQGLLAPYAAVTLLFMAVSAAYLTFLVRVSSGLALAFERNRRLRSVALRLSGCIFVGFGLKVALAAR
ncbi:MAG TPA: LysE family transporter [Syntrophorhabdales bacterium]|nr:LysE family transporter [Syntrophorhabdales bacterium]